MFCLSKYNAKKITIDGIRFDSKNEAKYYEYLKLMKSQGKIDNFELQPKYELQPKFKKYGKTIRAINYIADFLIYHLDGTEEVIDVKGMATPVALQKRKEFDYKYPNLKLTWICRNIKYGDKHGWIEYDELQKIKRKNRRNKK